MVKRYFILFSLSVCTLLAAMLIIRVCSTPSNADLVVERWFVLENTIGITDNQIPSTFHRILKKPGHVVAQAQLPEGGTLQIQDKMYLYLPQINASYLEVYVNENLIGSFGCVRRKIGYIWYEPLIFLVPMPIKTVTIRVYGINEIGINRPVFLTSSLLKYSTLSFIARTFIPIMVGVCFMNGLILFIFARNVQTDRKRAYVYLAITNFFAASWLFRALSFEFFSNEIVFLLLRKLFISSAYFAFAFSFESISNFYYSAATKLDKLLVIANIAAGISLFLMPNPYSLSVFNSRVLTLLLFLNAFLMLYKSIRSYSPMFFFSWALFSLTVLHDALVLVTQSGQRYLTVFSLPIAFAVFSYNMIIEYKDLLVRTRLAHARSITDNLTGAFNRGVLNELQLDPEDTVVFIDLNDLKYINDTYGHDEGDNVLKLLVSTVKSNIRSNDIVVRMGGDEFLIVLKNCSQEKANQIMERILQEFRESDPLKPSISYGIKAFSGNLTETIRVADSLMYKMKYQLKKNTNSQRNSQSNSA